MKSLKIFSVCLAAVVGLSSCASSWLDHDMTGSAITQEEYDRMDNTTAATVGGIYTYMYVVASSNHDDFGQKAFDISSDLNCGDMVMTAQAYGWFTSDAQGIVTTPAGRMWTRFFSMVMNCNSVLRSLDSKESMTEEERATYALALALRGFAYYSIANYMGPAAGDYTTSSYYGKGGKGPDYDLAPIYTQYDVNEAGLTTEKPLSTVKQVREFVRNDLSEAIKIYDDVNFVRSTKLAIDGNVARALLAYNYLQMAWAMDESDEYNPQRCYEEAYNTAMEVINSGEYSILSYDEVTTTGFVDVNNHSWMWGLDVTNENKGALASFWGHVDTHTYSYAYSGAGKACDEELYKEFAQAYPTDKRLEWFDPKQKYIPDWKFYDLKRGVKADEIDRDWLNDYVYMRVEEMYLVAAESAYRAGDLSRSRSILKDLLNERLADTTQPDSWNSDQLFNAIYLNWRIEMWGEGRGYITFKRFNQDGKGSRTSGANSFVKNRTITATGFDCQYVMPSSEASYNNEVTK